MADTLPPLEQMPDVAPPSDKAAAAARFSSRFGGQDKSLAQRTRHNEDIQAYAQELQRAREAHQAEEMRNNKGARDLHFRQQAADLKEALAVKSEARAAEIHTMKLQNMQAAQDAAHALERERVAREQAINNKAETDANNRAQVYEKWTALNNEGVKPGTLDYAKRTLDILVQHGGSLDASTRKMFTDTAKITTTADPVAAADEAVSGWDAIHAALKDKGINADVTGTMLPSGKYGFQLHEKKAPIMSPELKTLKTGLAHAQVQESLASEADKPAVQAGIKSLEGKISTIENPVPSSGAGMGDVKTAESQVASPIDRTALAQKALDDPNATEAHKSAARKILGYQGE